MTKCLARPCRPRPERLRALALMGAGLALLLTVVGCVTRRPDSQARPFDFSRDAFSFANGLLWEYHYSEATGKMEHRERLPKPDYTHHCFVVAKSARQFHQFALFRPDLPRLSPEQYRPLVGSILGRDPARNLPPAGRVVIPGYADLKSFSHDHEGLLKREAGGAWQSYFQRGNWRMIAPFFRSHQEETAGRLCAAIDANYPPVVHLACFPSLRINHAVLLFDYRAGEEGIEFTAYDPNEPDQSATLTYDARERTFRFPANFYFQGGNVNVYEIYRSWCF